MKTQYKAIIASAVVVMLCLSAIGGITYSWFSDSEQSEINVTTGKIDLKVDTSDVKVKSYNGSSKDVTGTTDTDVGGKVKVTTNSGTATLSIDFNGAVPGDELSFKATISMFSTIKTVYSESATVSMNGSAVSKHPFTITGLNTSSVPYGPIGTSAVYEQIGEKTVTIKFNSGSDDNEWMGKTFKIQLKFEAYQSNAPVYDSITETISEGTNTIGVSPLQQLPNPLKSRSMDPQTSRTRKSQSMRLTPPMPRMHFPDHPLLRESLSTVMQASLEKP